MQEQPNILVIDDKPGIRTTLAENGYQGIVAAENTNFKIAFIDMKMQVLMALKPLKESRKLIRQQME